MIHTSDEFRLQVAKGGCRWHCKINVDFGDMDIDLDESNFRINTFSFDSSTSERDTFEVGSAYAGEFDVDLENGDGRFNHYDFTNARITAFVGLELPTGETEWIQRGIFTVDSAKKNNDIVSITAYDNMIKFDQLYADVSTAVYPLDLREILQDICDKCGVKLHTTEFTNWGYSVPTRPTDESLTCRQIVSYVAQLAGCWARIDNTGGLILGWYDFSVDYKPTLQHLNACTVAENDVEITGVTVTPQDGDTYLAGEQGYMVTIADNPLVQELPENIAQSLGEKLIGFRFRPLEVSCLDNPTIEAGDIVDVIDARGNKYTTIVSNQSYTIGNWETVSADAETENENQSPQTSETAKIKAVVDVSTKNLADIVYAKENSGKRELSSLNTEIIRINFTANTQANPIFNAEINFVITAGGTIEFSYLVDNVSYPLRPKQTVSEGYSIIHLFLPLIGMKGNQAHSISVSMRSDDAKGYIEKSSLLATVNGQGLAASTTSWDGVIELSETIGTVTAKIGPSAKTISENVSAQMQTPQQYGNTESVSACAKIGISVKSITENISTESEEAE